jgi:hypothetical protein
VELAEIYRSAARASPITQDDLAGMAGTTRPTANRCSAGWRTPARCGWKGPIEVIDLASLRRHGGLLA